MFCVMPTRALASFSGGRLFSGNQDGSSVRHPPPYDAATYIDDFAAYFDMPPFSRPPNIDAWSVLSYGLGVHDTPVGAWRNVGSTGWSRCFRFTGCLFCNGLAVWPVSGGGLVSASIGRSARWYAPSAGRADPYSYGAVGLA